MASGSGRRRAGLAAGFAGTGTSESLDISMYPIDVVGFIRAGFRASGMLGGGGLGGAGIGTRAFVLGASLSDRAVKSRKSWTSGSLNRLATLAVLLLAVDGLELAPSEFITPGFVVETVPVLLALKKSGMAAGGAAAVLTAGLLGRDGQMSSSESSLSETGNGFV